MDRLPIVYLGASTRIVEGLAGFARLHLSIPTYLTKYDRKHGSASHYCDMESEKKIKKGGRQTGR
jgi:hypothetical protein